MAECQDCYHAIQDDGFWVWPLLTIHDQLVVEVEEDICEAVRDLNSSIFSQVMIDRETGRNLWRVPIKSDGQIMSRWEKD